MQTFEARVSFLSSLATEQTYTIHYTAPGVDAVCDAFDWADARHGDFPELFGPVACIKVYLFNPMPIVKGEYSSPVNMWLYEWKYDTGKLRPTRVLTR